MVSSFLSPKEHNNIWPNFLRNGGDFVNFVVILWYFYDQEDDDMAMNMK